MSKEITKMQKPKEKMPQLNVKMEWTVTLTTHEMRMVLKALGGRLKDDDVKAASELGENLSKLRAVVTKNSLNENEKLFSNLNL